MGSGAGVMTEAGQPGNVTGCSRVFVIEEDVHRGS